MYLKRIEIAGFKSFYSKTIILLPRPQKRKHGVTAIVGPNGSGKSNVCDALKWGLGIQSKKEVRSKKGDDVIFAGSTSKKELRQASVALHFDNSQKSVPIDYETIVITRKIYADKENEYFINDHKVRLLDIMQLLGNAGIGQQSYSIINQGMADRLLLATPIERRKIIEEAAKVKHFQIKKERSEQKLAASKANLEKAESLLLEIKPHLKTLERQAKKKIQQNELQKKLEELSHTYFGYLWHRLMEEKKSNLDARKLFAENRARIEKELAELATALEAAKKSAAPPLDLKSYQVELERIRKQESELLRQLSGHESTMGIMKEKIRFELATATEKVDIPYVKQRLSSVMKQIDQLIAKSKEGIKLADVRNLRKLVLQLSSEISAGVVRKDNTQVIKGLEAKIVACVKEIQSVENHLTHLSEQRRTVDKEISEQSRQNELAKSEATKLEKEYRQMIFQKDTLKDKSNSIEVELAKIEVEEKNLIARTVQITKKAPEHLKYQGPERLNTAGMESEIERLLRQVDVVSAIDEEVVKEYEETRERHEFLSKESEDLKGAIASLKKVIKEMEAKIGERFLKTFNQVNDHFSSYFKIIFGGGSARLFSVDIPVGSAPKKNDGGESVLSAELEAETENPEEIVYQKGIDIKATPPGKKIRNVGMLSGGEKALTSLAFLFAIIGCSPPPFVMLDEVDAALDEANSARFARIIREMAERTQFIIITHNREVMKEAQLLYGVTMQSDGVSRLLSVKLEETEELTI